jgi:hypothetical protein
LINKSNTDGMRIIDGQKQIRDGNNRWKICPLLKTKNVKIQEKKRK